MRVLVVDETRMGMLSRPRDWACAPLHRASARAAPNPALNPALNILLITAPAYLLQMPWPCLQLYAILRPWPSLCTYFCTGSRGTEIPARRNSDEPAPAWCAVLTVVSWRVYGLPEGCRGREAPQDLCALPPSGGLCYKLQTVR